MEVDEALDGLALPTEECDNEKAEAIDDALDGLSAGSDEYMLQDRENALGALSLQCGSCSASESDGPPELLAIWDDNGNPTDAASDDEVCMWDQLAIARAHPDSGSCLVPPSLQRQPAILQVAHRARCTQTIKSTRMW